MLKNVKKKIKKRTVSNVFSQDAHSKASGFITVKEHDQKSLPLSF